MATKEEVKAELVRRLENGDITEEQARIVAEKFKASQVQSAPQPQEFQAGPEQPPAEFQQAMGMMNDNQKEGFMGDLGSWVGQAYDQLVNPYERLQRRKAQASLEGKELKIPFAERMQSAVSGHLQRTPETEKAQPYWEMDELQELDSEPLWKGVAGLATGASNKELAESFMATDEFKNAGVTMTTDDMDNIILTDKEGKTFKFPSGADRADFLGFLAENLGLALGGRFIKTASQVYNRMKPLVKWLSSGRLKATASREALGQTALEGSQVATGSGEFDAMNPLAVGGTSALTRSLTLPFNAVRAEDMKSLAFGAIEGNQKAKDRLVQLMGSRRKEEVESMMDDMLFRVDPKTGNVDSADIDLAKALKYVTETPDPDLGVLARAFKANPKALKEAEDAGVLDLLDLSDLVSRSDPASTKVADAVMDKTVRLNKLRELSEELKGRLTASGVESGSFGRNVEKIGEDFFNSIKSQKEETKDGYTAFYDDLGPDAPIDGKAVINDIYALAKKRGGKVLKKGFKWSDGRGDVELTPFELQIVKKMRKREMEQEVVTESMDALGKVIKKVTKKKEKAPPQFRELDELKRTAYDMKSDPQFYDRHGGYADEIHGILRKHVGKGVEDLEAKGILSAGRKGAWEKLNRDVINRKNEERVFENMFGKAIEESVEEGGMRFTKDLAGVTETAIGKVAQDKPQSLRNKILDLPKKFRERYVTGGLMRYLGRKANEKGFEGFGEVWSGLKNDLEMMDVVKKSMSDNQFKIFRTVGELSEIIHQTGATKASASEGLVKAMTESKESLLKNLMSDLTTSAGATFLTRSMQTIPLIGGSGSLALSLGMLNAMRKIGKREANLDDTFRFLRGPELKRLLGSELKDLDYKKFVNSNRVQSWMRMMGHSRGEGSQALESIVRSWARTDNNAPSEIKTEEEDK